MSIIQKITANDGLWALISKLLTIHLSSWERLSFQSTGSWHMFSNYKMLESVHLKYLAGFTLQSWFPQISCRFTSKVVQRFLQILILPFKGSAKTTQRQEKNHTAGNIFSSDRNGILVLFLE